ncbi:MAG: V-type ATPase 116kDa subunit family protein [Lachnospiraceae bacterium]
MIVKMKFISITGPKLDIDRVTNEYLSKYEIQLENALSELKTVDNLQPFTEVNPYKDALAKAVLFTGYLTSPQPEENVTLSLSEMLQVIREANGEYTNFMDAEQMQKEEQAALLEKSKMIEPFRPMQFVLHDVLKYRFIKFRFGRVSLDYYHKLREFTEKNPDVIFVEGARDANYVHVVYFTSRSRSEAMDAIFKSLHFERIFIPDQYDGTPEEAYQDLLEKIDGISVKLCEITKEIGAVLEKNAENLYAAKDMLEILARNFDVRKMAACVEDKHEDFYILCGWMSEKDVDAFIHDIKDDPNLFVIVEDEHADYFGSPPTKLKNPKVFRPFEMFVKMYGLPSHNEMDPTIFVALSYTLIFGVMFGDLGQGLCLFIGGFLLYKLKKIDLAGIISMAGLFSAFFGWMFGSVFGFEHIIDARWLRPQEAMTTLPVIGTMNTVFVVSIAFGMFMVIVTMIFHIITAIRSHDIENTFFDANGIAGLLFYAAVVGVMLLFLTGHRIPGTALLIIMFAIPLLLIALKEPLSGLITRRSANLSDGTAIFIVQAFFELFETLLSYFSNTLSFVRIGAFAVSHGAMMGVVMILAGAAAGHPNWIVIILGNLFVCAMEGLIVGIQVLRLEYYELFSRFYQGTGREFKPYGKNIM